MKHERFVFIMSCTIIFAISCVGLCKVSEGENGGADFSNMPLSVSATYSLINGDAKQYDKECRERAEYLSGTEEKGVTLAPLSVTPAPISIRILQQTLFTGKMHIWHFSMVRTG